MVKSFIISSFFILITGFTVLGGEVDKQLHQDCLYPTIYIGRADKKAYGSGVIVRSEKVDNQIYKNAFITCGHLYDDEVIDYEVKVFFYENWSQIKEIKSYAAVFYGVNRNFDLAVGMFYSEQEMSVAKMEFNPKIFLGNEVFRIGCGLGDEPRLDYGKLTSYNKGSKPLFRTSVYTIPGDSGSPLFHENKIIGIMVRIRVYRDNMLHSISYAIPLERFKTWDTGNLAFIWDKGKSMPSTPFRYLNFTNIYEIKRK